MALKNRSMYAILGILSLSPATGYDIKKYSDSVLASFWNENFGHIYPTLKKMQDEGMIEVVRHDEHDRKTVYGITDIGRTEFAAWLREETTPQPLRSEFMLKLLFSSVLPKAEVCEALQHHKERQEKRLSGYLGMRNDLARQAPTALKERVVLLNAILRSGIMAAETSIRWCDETLEALKASSVSPESVAAQNTLSKEGKKP